jgi:hypothetical protein
MSPAALTAASATLPSAFAVTTTFTAPTQCAQSVGGLTMLENDGFRIWLNAPLPVPGTTVSSCYPDQYISSFLLQTGGTSQAPFSALVCPDGYTTQGPFTSHYIACCPRFVRRSQFSGNLTKIVVGMALLQDQMLHRSDLLLVEHASQISTTCPSKLLHTITQLSKHPRYSQQPGLQIKHTHIHMRVLR